MYNPISCQHPKIVRNRFTGELISVPCGKCSCCLSRASSLWVSRLQEESTCHTYTLFGTLTYAEDLRPVVDVSKEIDRPQSFYDACVQSSDYITFCKNVVPCLNVKDVQLFFKKLRSKISYYHGTQEKFKIRYFLVGEYGPTTFHPHYHYILWFDAPELVSTIKEYIYESWQFANPHPSLSSFLRRNKHVFIHGHAEKYVAGYLNKFSHLPKILSEKPFRPFHVQSSAPPIGTIRILKESIQELVFGNALQVTLKRLSSGQSVSVSLWRGFENRYFPKVIGFASLSSRDRISLYSISLKMDDKRFEDFESFELWVLREWFSFDSRIILLKSVIPRDTQDDVFSERFSRCLRRIFTTSSLVVSLSSSFGLSVSDYVSRIEAYYSRKEYNALCRQLELQESLSLSLTDNDRLCYYPFAIDTLFAENLRNLDLSVFDDYCHDFDVNLCSPSSYSLVNFSYYQVRKNLCDRIVNDNHKIRIKKDYVDRHPECYQRYSSNLLTSKF